MPAAALAAHCARLEALDLSAQYALDEASLDGLARCPNLRRLELTWPLQRGAAARRLREALPRLEVT